MIRIQESVSLTSRKDDVLNIIQQSLALGSRSPFWVTALGLLHDKDVAEDCLQSAFIKSYDHADSIKGDVFGYIYQSVVNQALDYLKAPKNHMGSYDYDNARSPVAMQDDLMVNDELNAVLSRAIEALPDRLRLNFLAFQLYGQSHAHIATQIGSTVGGSKMAVQRAKGLLREYLATYHAA